MALYFRLYPIDTRPKRGYSQISIADSRLIRKQDEQFLRLKISHGIVKHLRSPRPKRDGVN